MTNEQEEVINNYRDALEHESFLRLSLNALGDQQQHGEAPRHAQPG